MSDVYTPAESSFLDEQWSVTEAWAVLAWTKAQRPDWFAEMRDVVEAVREQRRPR